jgi:hypothetical protein
VLPGCDPSMGTPINETRKTGLLMDFGHFLTRSIFGSNDPIAPSIWTVKHANHPDSIGPHLISFLISIFRGLCACQKSCHHPPLA